MNLGNIVARRRHSQTSPKLGDSQRTMPPGAHGNHPKRTVHQILRTTETSSARMKKNCHAEGGTRTKRRFEAADRAKFEAFQSCGASNTAFVSSPPAPAALPPSRHAVRPCCNRFKVCGAPTRHSTRRTRRRRASGTSPSFIREALLVFHATHPLPRLERSANNAPDSTISHPARSIRLSSQRQAR